jgi:hypothetical protein
MIDGTKISLNGKDYIVPPLNFKSIKKLQPVIENLTKVDLNMSGDQIDSVCEIVHTALIRNYPELTKDEVLDGLDLGNAHSIIMAIMGASGLKAVPAGEAQAASSPQ